LKNSLRIDHSNNQKDCSSHLNLLSTKSKDSI